MLRLEKLEPKDSTKLVTLQIGSLARMKLFVGAVMVVTLAFANGSVGRFNICDVIELMGINGSYIFIDSSVASSCERRRW